MKYKEDFVEQVVLHYKQQLRSLRNFSLSTNAKGIQHRHLVSFATYAPWLDDQKFMGLYRLVEAHTLVDIYRCYELFSWVIRNSHIPGDILEVGVWRGGTGCLMGAALQMVSPDATLYLVDTFSGVVKAGPDDTWYKGGEHQDTSPGVVKGLAGLLKLQNVQVLSGIYPDEVNPALLNGLRLCHIDVDTYQSAKDVFCEVWPKVNRGGAVIFDDYGFWGCEGITRLCNELKPVDGVFFYNLNGHAIFVKS